MLRNAVPPLFATDCVEDHFDDPSHGLPFYEEAIQWSKAALRFAFILGWGGSPGGLAVGPLLGHEPLEDPYLFAGNGRDGHTYVIEDLSCHLSADGWARRAVSGYHRHRADRIVAEVNNGGDLVERVMRTVDRSVSYRAVRASRGKAIRAEPVAALYEQGRVHHVGLFADLEDQMCAFTPDQYAGSPDRVDALVWCLTELMLTQQGRLIGTF
jgi:predicted phage terminase large subunit-like protein